MLLNCFVLKCYTFKKIHFHLISFRFFIQSTVYFTAKKTSCSYYIVYYFCTIVKKASFFVEIRNQNIIFSTNKFPKLEMYTFVFQVPYNRILNKNIMVLFGAPKITKWGFFPENC